MLNQKPETGPRHNKNREREREREGERERNKGFKCNNGKLKCDPQHMLDKTLQLCHLMPKITAKQNSSKP